MSAVPPAVFGGPVAQPPAAPLVGPVTGPVPAALLALPPGRPVAATVEALLAGGNVRLATAAGPLTVALERPPPPGSELGLLIQRSPAGLRARLLPTPAGSNVLPATTGAASARPAAGAPTAPTSAAPVANGATATGPTAAAPATTVAPTTATLMTPMSWSDGSVRVAGSPGAGGAENRTLPTGTRLLVRVTAPPAPAPGGGATPPAAVVTAGERRIGQPIGMLGGNRPMLRVAGAVIALDSGSLPPGRLPLIEFVGEAPAPRAQHGDGRLPGIVSDGSALTEAAEIIAAAGTAPRSAAPVAVVPRPERDLAAAMMRFLAALGDDGDGWPGTAATRLLEGRAPDLAARVGEEMREAARQFEQPTAGDWRTATLPFLTPDGPRSLRVHLRGGRQADGDGGRRGTRFVVDIRLSRLGRVQLDGLAPAGARRFDLLVRTETPLPPPIRDDIRATFAEAAAIGGLAGTLGFRAAPPDFVEIDAEATGLPETAGILA